MKSHSGGLFIAKEMQEKSLWDNLPDDLTTIILNFRKYDAAIITIQKNNISYLSRKTFRYAKAMLQMEVIDPIDIETIRQLKFCCRFAKITIQANKVFWERLMTKVLNDIYPYEYVGGREGVYYNMVYDVVESLNDKLNIGLNY
jgi:hypothetical protein